MIVRFFRKYPTAIFVILLAIHYLASYPGGMSPDTYNQFDESLSLTFSSHHPPITAMLWSLLNKIYQGPQLMLLLNLSMLWGGMLILYKSDNSNKYRWLYFIIPFTPSILAQSGMVWKDLSFAYSFLLAFAICTYYIYKNERPSNLVLLALILISFYGISVKFQAKFPAVALMMFISCLLFKSWVKRVISCIIFSTILIGFNSFIISNLTIDTHSEQHRQFFDIADIAIDLNDDSILPEYIRKNPIYDFEKIKSYKSDPYRIIKLIYAKDKVFDSTQDPAELKILNDAFYKAILEHPILYLKNRYDLYVYIVNAGSSDFMELLFTPDKPYGFHKFENNLLERSFSRYIKATKSFIRNKQAFWLLTIYIVALIYLLKKKKVSYSHESTILIHLSSISILYIGALLLTPVCADYRFAAVLRVLSFASIPIFLKFVMPHLKNNVIEEISLWKRKH